MSPPPVPDPDGTKAWIAAAIIWLAVVLSLTSGPAGPSGSTQVAAIGSCR